MVNKKTINYTVGDLIQCLKEYPQGLPVLVSGYEDGFENIIEPKIELLEHHADKPYYSGEFQEVSKDNVEDRLEAVVLRRMIRNV